MPLFSGSTTSMENPDATGLDMFIRAERMNRANETKYTLGGNAMRRRNRMEANCVPTTVGTLPYLVARMGATSPAMAVAP